MKLCNISKPISSNQIYKLLEKAGYGMDYLHDVGGWNPREGQSWRYGRGGGVTSTIITSFHKLKGWRGSLKPHLVYVQCHSSSGRMSLIRLDRLVKEYYCSHPN